MKIGTRLKRSGKVGYRWLLYLMSGATAVVVAACYGMVETFGISYENNARQIFAANCDGCHSGTQPPAGYRTDDYNELFGGGSDSEPNVIAGDPNCRLLTRLGENPDHELSQADADELYEWIVNHNAQRY